MRHLKLNIFVLVVLFFGSVVSYPPGFVDPDYFAPSPVDYYLYEPFQRSALPADDLEDSSFQDGMDFGDENEAVQRALLYRPQKTQPQRFIIGDRPKAAPELGVIARFAEDPSDAVRLAARYQRDPVGAINFAATFAHNPLRALEIAAKFASHPLQASKVADRFAVDPLGGILIALQFLEPDDFLSYFPQDPSGNYDVLISFVHSPVKAMSIANAFDSDPVRTMKQIASQSDDPLRVLLLAKQFAKNPSKAIAITEQYKVDPEGAMQVLEMYAQRALSFDVPEDEGDFQGGMAVRASDFSDSMETPRTRGLLSSIGSLFGLNPKEQADIGGMLAEAEAREEALKGTYNSPKYSYKPIQNTYPAYRPTYGNKPPNTYPAYRPTYGRKAPGSSLRKWKTANRYLELPPWPEF